jgi:hypothetical protein
MPLYVPVV